MPSSEHNEVIGKIALLEDERRSKLLAQAKGWKHPKIMATILGFTVPVAVSVAGYFFQNNMEIMVVAALAGNIVVVGLTANSANSRIDALVQLIGDEKLLNKKKELS